ncbi:MAG: hypothetical protein ICV87_04305 [Gemmatimonadetes bacterium]|nr:hypothetical protein [Gemmatimonadota bacterium]
MLTEELLLQARVGDSFRAALRTFRSTGRPNERIAFDRLSPAVKVERMLTKVLVEYPDLAIESIEVRGSSGCEFFRGTAIIRTADEERHVRFHWDCKWRAEQEGWTDYFGFPDQGRAAREFGYDCFRAWEVEKVVALPPALVVEMMGSRQVPTLVA